MEAIPGGVGEMGCSSLAGKRILVTGASSGIGKATAIQLSRQGARVVISGRDEARLAETLNHMKPGDHTVAPFDLGEAHRIPEWMRTLAGKGGQFDGLAHCAGVQRYLGIRQLEPDAIAGMLHLNVTASLMLLKGIRHRQVRAVSSTVVLVSSVMALGGEAMQSAYAASKGAIVSLVRCAAIELGQEHIRVNAVAPGVVETAMTDAMFSSLTEQQIEAVRKAHPLGFGKPNDIAHAICYLLSERSRWVTGTTMVVDGGYLSR